MDRQDIPAIPFALELERIRRVLDQELYMFKKEFGERPMSQVQDQRGLLLAWLAVFIPEAFSSRHRIRLEEAVRYLKMEGDYLLNGWFELLPLEAALFALTRDKNWLRIAMRRWDHDSSEFRRQVYQCLALVAPRIGLDYRGLLERAEYCLKRVYFFNHEMLALLASMGWPPEEKQRLFAKWLEQYYGRLNQPERSALEQLSQGQAMLNPHIGWILKLQAYACLRIACGDPLADSGLSAPRMGSHLRMVKGFGAKHRKLVPDQPGLFSDAPEDALAMRVWERINVHPFFNPYLEIHSSLKKAVN